MRECAELDIEPFERFGRIFVDWDCVGRRWRQVVLVVDCDKDSFAVGTDTGEAIDTVRQELRGGHGLYGRHDLSHWRGTVGEMSGTLQS